MKSPHKKREGTEREREEENRKRKDLI